ncbi:hypothetical protein [Streptomyces chumphonensis]|uniref:hypothetical protein n=1 Tax=Streptomyces chumphonensis TaxID=1214925 RepID=UPI003D727DB4
MAGELRNPYPEEFGYLEIGTPINADTNRVIPTRALEMGKLAAENLLQVDVNTRADRSIRGGAFDARSQEAWGVSAALAFGIKSGFADVNVSVELGMMRNACHTGGSQKVDGYSVQQGEIRMLPQGVKAERVLSCATTEFRAAVARIREAPDELLAREIADFYRDYGTGFVSTLTLGAFGVFEGTADHASSSEERKYSIAAGVSAGGTALSVGSAAKYCEQHFGAEQSASFRAYAFGMPAASGPNAWAEQFCSTFANTQMNAMNNTAAWERTFAAPVASVAEPTFRKKSPTPDALPKERKGDLAPAVAALQFDRFSATFEEQHHRKPDASDYTAHLEQLAREARVSDVDIARRSAQVASSDRVADSGNGTPTDPPPPSKGSTATQVSGDLSLGGFGITGFAYTPWEKVLPELGSLSASRTTAQVALGQALVWMSVKGMLAQYLSFCTHFPEVSGESITVDSKAFSHSVDEMADYVTGRLDGTTQLPLDFVSELEIQFRGKLARRRFSLMPHYVHLLEEYAWLKSLPFGGVPIVGAPEGRAPKTPAYAYQVNTYPDAATLDSAHGVTYTDLDHLRVGTLLEKKAVRLYPVLATNAKGKPFFLWVSCRPAADQGESAPALVNGDNASLWVYPKAQGWAQGHRMLLCRPRRTVKGALDVALAVDPPVEPYPVPKSDGSFGDVWVMRSRKPAWHVAAYAIDGPGEWWKRLMVTGEPALPSPPSGVVSCGDVRLLPVGYEDVKDMELPNGGIPMWREPRTDELVAKLRDLAPPRSGAAGPGSEPAG